MNLRPKFFIPSIMYSLILTIGIFFYMSYKAKQNINERKKVDAIDKTNKENILRKYD